MEQLEDRLVPSNNFIVNSLGDAGQGQFIAPSMWMGDLRYCINQLDANGGKGGTGYFSFQTQGPSGQQPLTGTIDLTSSLPAISQPAIINGTGMNSLEIDGQNDYQVFDIGNNATVTINNLTVSEGSANFGGGIENFADLTLADVEVNNCRAAIEGGGICNSGSLTIHPGCTINYDFATNEGGGIYNGPGGDVGFALTGTGAVNLSYDRVTGGNLGSMLGGGIYNHAGSITVGTTLNITSCSASPTGDGKGGGVANDGQNAAGGGVGTFTVEGAGGTEPQGEVNISGCYAHDGGGFYNGYNGSATLTNGTFSNDAAETDGFNMGRGGAMYLAGSNGGVDQPSSTRFENTSVNSNCTADGLGAGVYYEAGALFPFGYTGLTDKADPDGQPV